MSGGLKASFDPIVDRRTRLLILGSLPGEQSLALGQYYGNPRNQFWALIGAVIGQPAPSGYAERLVHLTAHRVGLWDVVRTARRSGSLDTAIRDAEAHPLAELATSLPDLRAIAFNGAKAASLGMRQFAPDESRWRLVTLPSSSPAHAIGFERKLQAWLALRDFL